MLALNVMVKGFGEEPVVRKMTVGYVLELEKKGEPLKAIHLE